MPKLPLDILVKIYKNGRKWEKVEHNMFIGTYYHSVDSRNRISVPRKFREQLGRRVVVTRGLDGCLFLYAKETWARMEAVLTQTPLTRQDARSFTRLMLSGAVVVEIDKIGRILVPGYLKEYAKLKNEAAILGVGERIEIWNKDQWETSEKKLEQDSEAIAERLSELGI